MLSRELLRAGVNRIMQLLLRLYLQRIVHKPYKQKLGPHYFANILLIKENGTCLSSLRNIGFDALYNLHDPSSSYIPHFYISLVKIFWDLPIVLKYELVIHSLLNKPPFAKLNMVVVSLGLSLANDGLFNKPWIINS